MLWLLLSWGGGGNREGPPGKRKGVCSRRLRRAGKGAPGGDGIKADFSSAAVTETSLSPPNRLKIELAVSPRDEFAVMDGHLSAGLGRTVKYRQVKPQPPG